MTGSQSTVRAGIEERAGEISTFLSYGVDLPKKYVAPLFPSMSEETARARGAPARARGCPSPCGRERIAGDSSRAPFHILSEPAYVYMDDVIGSDELRNASTTNFILRITGHDVRLRGPTGGEIGAA